MITTEIQIRFSDMDMLRHANNVALYHYYDLGIRDYFRSVMLFSEDQRRDQMIAKVKATANFFAPIHLNDNIEVNTFVIKIGNRSLTFYQEVVDKDTKTVKSSCESIFAGYDLLKESSCEVDPHWKELIKEHEKL
ncbi:MAG: thioesterase family protein [Rikenellaceae bacterium]